jgi:hypothetical protein
MAVRELPQVLQNQEVTVETPKILLPKRSSLSLLAVLLQGPDQMEFENAL